MVIVGGTIEVEPDERESYLANRVELMLNSRREDGCLEYTFAADPADPGRVVLFERWASQEALDAHLAAFQAQPPSRRTTVPAAKTSTMLVYDATNERSLY